MAHTYDSLRKEIAAKQFHPLYFFTGEEGYFADQLLDLLEEKSLSPEEKDFNLSVLYGREVDAQAIVSDARRYPMMSEYVVVLVREGQNIKDWEPIVRYAKNPNPTTLSAIAIRGKGLDKRGLAYKALQKESVYIEFSPLKAYQIPGWIENQIRSSGYRISPKAAALLAEHAGEDLALVSKELDKLMALSGEGAEITSSTIERVVGINKEFNNFELIKALSQRDQVRSHRIAHALGQNQKATPLVLTLGLLFSTFAKALVYTGLPNRNSKEALRTAGITDWALRDIQTIVQSYPQGKLVKIIRYLRDADLASKGVQSGGSSDQEILKELIFKIVY